MAKQHDKQFKLDAVQYYQDHKDLGVRGCAENLGIGYSTLTKWLKDFRESGIFLQKGRTPGFRLRNVENFRCLSLRISCMAPSRNYKISLMSNLILIVRMRSGVRILPTYKTAHTKAELLAG